MGEKYMKKRNILLGEIGEDAFRVAVNKIRRRIGSRRLFKEFGEKYRGRGGVDYLFFIRGKPFVVEIKNWMAYRYITPTMVKKKINNRFPNIGKRLLLMNKRNINKIKPYLDKSIKIIPMENHLTPELITEYPEAYIRTVEKLIEALLELMDMDVFFIDEENRNKLTEVIRQIFYRENNGRTKLGG